MSKEEKKYTVKSPKGVEYTVREAKARFLVREFDCKWVGEEPKQQKIEPPQPPENTIEQSGGEKPAKRTRRTKAQIEADKAKENE